LDLLTAVPGLIVVTLNISRCQKYSQFWQIHFTDNNDSGRTVV